MKLMAWQRLIGVLMAYLSPLKTMGLPVDFSIGRLALYQSAIHIGSVEFLGFSGFSLAKFLNSEIFSGK
jgi:hypothetical protein